MALYAFDGTWNENKPDDAEDTNVFKFKEAYQGNKFYVEGVGTRFGILGRVFGGIFGAGSRRLEFPIMMLTSAMSSRSRRA